MYFNSIEFSVGGNMNYLVVGYNISGKSAAKLLKQKGHKVYVYDSSEKAKNNIQADRFEYVKQINKTVLNNIDVCVVSPSIRPDSDLVKTIKNAGIKLIGELELGYQNYKGKLYAITGTNGKTTATVLLSHLFGTKAPAVGNIGVPITDKIKAKKLVCEVSSFQLTSIEKFRPNIAGITYIGCDHIDYHGSIDEYINAKYNIAQNMKGKDKLVLNASDAASMKLTFMAKCKVWTFSSAGKCRGAYVEDGKIYFIKSKKPQYIMDVKDIKLLGKHNIENVLMVIAMARLAGLSPKVIRKGVSTFYGLPHRLKVVACIDGVTYINDSKATNISATQVAIKSVGENIILLLGGSDKGYEYDELIKDLTVKKVIAFGGIKEKLENTFARCNFQNYLVADNLQQAVTLAKTIAKAGDNVLLSPASASHDQFQNYEQRGEAFEKCVFDE